VSVHLSDHEEGILGRIVNGDAAPTARGSLPRAADPRTRRQWYVANFALLAACLFITLVGWGIGYAVTESSDTFGSTVASFVLFLGWFAALFLVPSTFAYLVIVERSANAWGASRPRLVAIALSPLATVLFGVLFSQARGGVYAGIGLTVAFGVGVAVLLPPPPRIHG
jgi:hypothetical protein